MPNIQKQCYEKHHQAVEIPATWCAERLSASAVAVAMRLDLGSLHGACGSPPRLPARPLASPRGPKKDSTDCLPRALDASPKSPGQQMEASLCYGLRAIVSHEGMNPRPRRGACADERCVGLGPT